jgi:hypothetical protein
MRERMLQASEKADPDFPDGSHVVLTQFAYIGDVTTSNGSKLRVAAAQSVITGMLAPRGQAWLSFHDEQGRFVGEHHIDPFSPAHWCDGSRVLFVGSQTNGEQSGNALELSQGFANRHYVSVPVEESWTPNRLRPLAPNAERR